MKKISIITLFPDMIKGFINESIIKRAVEKKLVEIELINLRDFAIDSYGSVDDRPYGGGTGMILRIDVLNRALLSITNNQNPISKTKVIITSPKGKRFEQKLALQYSRLNHLIIIAGHYEGVDERVNQLVDEKVSLGDFIMTGGEITASAIIDSVVRLISGVLKKTNATKLESFFEADIERLFEVTGKNKILLGLQKKGRKTVRLLEYPQYTRPSDFNGIKVPRVLLKGNHKEIENWRLKEAFKETLKLRPDLLK